MDRRTLFQGLAAVTALVPGPALARWQSLPMEDGAEIGDVGIRYMSQCGFVYDGNTEPAGSYDFYSYQRHLYQMSSVSRRCSPSATSKKVQHFWWVFRDRLTCDGSNFNVRNGNLLKFAVSRKFDDFIEEVVNIWQVPLNRIDASDGRTVLDYIDAELANARGTPLENKLRSYRETFRAAGARTARELAVTPDTFVDPYDREIAPLKSAWEKVCYLSENRQAVKRGGRWGYLDENGRMAVEPRFQSAFSFSEGRAPVALDGRWGFIDLAGAIAVPARYHDVRAFRDGQAEVTVDGRTWTSVGPTGQSL